MTRPLTERRAADRTIMAAKIIDLAKAFPGVTVALPPADSIPPRRVEVFIEGPRGLCVWIDFDGQSRQPDCYCMPWYISSDSDARLSDHFGRLAGASVNPHHFAKCTAFAEGFDELCRRLSDCLAAACDGSAFDPEREAAMIAKNGTAAERSARWAEWFAQTQPSPGV